MNIINTYIKSNNCAINAIINILRSQLHITDANEIMHSPHFVIIHTLKYYLVNSLCFNNSLFHTQSQDDNADMNIDPTRMYTRHWMQTVVNP